MKLLGVGSPFDSTNRFQTSSILSPVVLAFARLLIACYIFVALFYRIARSAVIDGSRETRNSFSYFTNLTYWGLGCYFAVSAVHTLVYAFSGKAPLERWPKVLQFLHSLLYTTIITFPFLVTVVYWVILAPDENPFSTVYSAWNNISFHALNSVFALFEILIPRTERPPWIHIPFLILLLAGYLGVAYITKATKNFYTYSFLNPNKSGPGMVAAYVFGITAAICVVFVITRLIIWLRLVLCEKVFGLKGKFSSKARGGRGDGEKGEHGRLTEKELP
ncbi:hypothetical protein L873DRAFT_746575 [Choiromyces venosus 120613-1]|uniref:FAR-17a/AIG1-like protein n=1 Tax=Choiromyces venosus 120613-1 TaxID=1336337 RepID=A0A3N4JVJ4_9PEZI|nr:hypothetical protein L873DRAFT_746575 [Choiromyces venosus 120613-1]